MSRKNKDKTKRVINLNGLDKTLDLSKVTSINQVDKEFIYLDKLNDGTWRLVYTSNTISDIQNLKSLDIIREDNG